MPHAPQPVPAVFSIGYQLRPLDDMIANLQQAGVTVLVDVRDVAWSQKRGFSGSQLASTLSDIGIDYVHAKFAGNPRALRREAETHRDCLELFDAYLGDNPSIVEDLDTLLEGLILRGERPCLLCYERHPDDCHRSVLLRWWAAAGGEADIVHLDPDGAPRFMEGRIDCAAEAAWGNAPRPA